MQIVICDDEKVWTDKIKILLKKYLPQDVNYSCRCYLSGRQCLDALLQAPADILFMDIEMEDLSGIDVVRSYKNVFTDTIVFFVTSHATYFTNLFRLGSFQCLLKPIDENDFKIDLYRAVEQYKLKHTKIEVRTENAVQEVAVGDILYIEVYKKQINIHLREGKLCHRGNIAYYEGKLAGFGFIKTHKSFLVNVNHMQKITNDSVVLDVGNLTVPLSRNFKDSVRQAFAKKNFGECL